MVSFRSASTSALFLQDLLGLLRLDNQPNRLCQYTSMAPDFARKRNLKAKSTRNRKCSSLFGQTTRGTVNNVNTSIL